jgi:hypothetical protein
VGYVRADACSSFTRGDLKRTSIDGCMIQTSSTGKLMATKKLDQPLPHGSSDLVTVARLKTMEH